MNPATEYWEERLQQMQVDHEAEVRRLRDRIVELEDRLELTQKNFKDFVRLVLIEISH